MRFLLLAACDLKEEDRLLFASQNKDSHPAYLIEAERKLLKTLKFLVKNADWSYSATPAGVDYLRTFTSRKDIRPIKNQVVIE